MIKVRHIEICEVCRKGPKPGEAFAQEAMDHRLQKYSLCKDCTDKGHHLDEYQTPSGLTAVLVRQRCDV